jgi:hypothetical protein
MYLHPAMFEHSYASLEGSVNIQSDRVSEMSNSEYIEEELTSTINVHHYHTESLHRQPQGHLE